MDNPQAIAETDWKPKPWIALLLGLFAMPLSMLYLAKPRFALYYLLAVISLGLADFSGITPWSKYISLTWSLVIFCTVHSYRLAKNGTFTLPRAWYGRWYGMVAIAVVYGAATFGERSFLYEPFKVPSVSMAPALPQGVIVVTQKLGIGNYGSFGIRIAKMPLSKEIERGDIFVFQYPRDPSTDYVKRIIGLPGDVVSYKSKVLYINGTKLQTTSPKDAETEQVMEERYGDKSWQIRITSSSLPDDFEGKVPEHQYFVLGDNRDNSSDSRQWGFVPEENLVGKVVYVVK